MLPHEKMKTVELFSGSGSFSKYAKKLGHDTFTVDIEKKYKPDMVGDILNLSNSKVKLLHDKLKEANIVWMSPPCTSFSIASGNRHWTADRKPKTDQAIKGKLMLEFCLDIITEFEDKIWFIENPVGRARWFMPERFRHTVWYCQYGDDRAKPTDIWTNLKWWSSKKCRNNNPGCSHIKAPRGSSAGTQGLSNAFERGKIPEGLFKELFKVINNNHDR